MRIISAFILRVLKKFFTSLRKFNPFTQNQDWTSLTVLPGIGIKNGQLFFDAGYRTPQDVLNASDEELLEIRGVGTNFLKRLRDHR